MFDDHEKTFKKDVIERLGKAKGRLRHFLISLMKALLTQWQTSPC
jgi:hypothetical protein